MGVNKGGVIMTEKTSSFVDNEELEKEKNRAWNKMREISKTLCKQLDEIKWEA